MSNRRVVFLTDFEFSAPGGAAWNRVLNYTKALSSRGVEVVLSSSRYHYGEDIEQIEISPGVKALKGEVILYKSTFEDFHFKRYYRFLKKVHKLYGSSANTRFFLYNVKLNTILLNLIFLKLLKGKKVVLEKNELELSIALNMGFNSGSILKDAFSFFYKGLRLLTSTFTDILSVFYSGLIAISTPFEKLYKPYNPQVSRIPILVDPESFKLNRADSSSESGPFNIGYFGHISEKKDGVASLIQSVKSINKYSKPRLELHLYGGFASYRAKYFKSLIDGKQVFFHGSIPASEVKPELQKFDLLALVRPLNLQTQYGFSTKLGEYLMSGVPVLASNVSDNAKYLEDGEEAFILNLGKEVDQIALEAKIRQIIEIPVDQRRQLGLKGREKALKEFDYRNHAQALTDFIFSL